MKERLSALSVNKLFPEEIESVASGFSTSLCTAVVSAITGCGLGLGCSILNCTGTEHLQRTTRPWSLPGIHDGISRITFSAAVSICASSPRAMVGDVISPLVSTTNSTTTTPCLFSFFACAGYFKWRFK